MAHHKRKGPKSTRAGCMLCKPHKRQGSNLKEREPMRARRHIWPFPHSHTHSQLALAGYWVKF